jgi:branched-chain amino acid aminotransferase
MGFEGTDYIWKNGEFVPWAECTTHVLTHALHYGTAVFEGIRCYDTAQGPEVFRLEEHCRRLLNSGKMIRMDIPYTVEELAAAIIETVRKNKVDRCYIRPIAYRGFGTLGVDPRNCPVDVVIAVWPWDSYLGEEAQKNGIDVAISSWRQRSVNATPGAIKSSASYLNSGLAHIECSENGFGEAVLLNEAGMVAEGSGENIFIVRDGVISTPPLSDGVLEGITRDSIIQIAIDLGYDVAEESLVRSDLYCADEVFFTGSAAELTPIHSVDRRVVGTPGPVTEALRDRFFAILHGEVPEYGEWLTYVNA